VSALAPLMIACDDPGRGGCARVAHALWRRLPTPRRKLLVTDLEGAPEDLFSAEERLGLPDRAIVAYPVDEKRIHQSTYDIRRALKLLEAERPAAILFHDSRALESMLALKRAARVLGVPFNATEHLVTPTFRVAGLTGRPRDLGWPRSARHVIFVSGDNRGRFLTERPEIADKAFVAPNGVVPSKGPWPDADARARLRALAGGAEDEPLVLVLARLATEKGQDLAIRACAAAQTRPWRLVLIGPDPDGRAPALLRLAAALGAADRVSLLGARTDARDLIRGADAMLVASRTEGLPLSVLEAMAEGVPVVATAVGGVAEALGEAAAGLVDPLGLSDEAVAQALAARLAALLGDDAAALRASRLGRARAAERYSVDAMVAAHARWLADLEADAASPDERAVRAARLLRRCAPPRGYGVAFANPGRAWSVLGRGWGGQQDWGVMAFERARLELPVPPAGGRFRITFEIVTPGRRPGRLVLVSGPSGFRARWRFTGLARRVRKVVEVAAPPGEDALAFDFMLRTRGVGAGRDLDADGRCAAFGLAAARVEPAPPAKKDARLRTIRPVRVPDV
jgi:glycosyltransferase involved in cell wall biosynthesis